MLNIHFRKHLLAVCIASASSVVFAETTETEETVKPKATLQTIVVTATEGEQPKANVEQKTAEKIQQELIQNNRDLVRYSPDVGIVDQGRHQKGFAIRGVEDNRVGISIDGVSLPDSEENSLYKRYGNLNTSRQSIDPELARTIDVVKGADSFNQGSGSIGGGVVYRTLEAKDLVDGESKFGGLYRLGFSSRNKEWVNTIGAAYMGEQAEAIMLYSHRYGHEMESNGEYTIPETDRYNARYLSYSRQMPDESKNRNNSYLAKFAWRFNDAHRAGVSFSGQRNKNYIIEDSAITSSSRWREADDRAERATYNVFYDYTPSSKWLALARLDADYQDTVTEAYNYEGYRKTAWSEARPSDTNIRTFNTAFKRIGVKVETVPLNWANTAHTLSMKASASERDFDVLHQDAYFLNRQWSSAADSTMMHPVKTRNYQVSLHDKVEITPQWTVNAGVRYDWTKHTQQDLNGLACRNCVKTDDAKFNNFSWTLGSDYQLNDTWKLGYSIGTGFRVPNASEMYFDYRDNAAGAWMSNPNLKAEKSLTQNLNVQGNGLAGQLALNLHHTQYKDFLNEQETWDNYTYEVWGTSYSRWRPVQQMQNIDQAKIYGVEFTGKLHLDAISPMSEGWKLFGSMGYSKASLSNGADLLSLQPLKAIVGLDYEQPDGKWGVFSRFTFMEAKAASQAKYIEATERDVNCRQETVIDPWSGTTTTQTVCDTAHETTLSTWPHLNKKAFVLDLFGFYRPTDKITLRAGVYNILDRKYHTWDSLRGLNNTGGVVNSVGLRPNSTYGGYPGLERYYAPGRNYSVAIEFKF